MTEITVTVSGPVGCGKSAIAGEIEIALKAIGVTVRMADAQADREEKNMTGADWASYLEMYQPSVVISEESAPAAPDDTHKCPICGEPFKPDDVCAMDISEGTCHAACLEGSPIVDLDTGEASDGPVTTYVYDEDAAPSQAEPVAWLRKWSINGRNLPPEFTDDHEHAEIWRGHPQTSEVIPLYAAPPVPAADTAK